MVAFTTPSADASSLVDAEAAEVCCHNALTAQNNDASAAADNASWLIGLLGKGLTSTSQPVSGSVVVSHPGNVEISKVEIKVRAIAPILLGSR